MNRADHLALDGHSLRLLVTVLEEGSVTGAANRLGLTQSAVSHALDRLRAITGEPLFVKSGRGIVATAHARELAAQAQDILDRLKAFSARTRFEPAAARLAVTIAANDFQRDLLLPGLFHRVRAQTADFRLRVIAAGTPAPELLRTDRCDLLLTPRPPEGADILQKLLLEDQYVCYYDDTVRAAPRTEHDYLAAGHIAVVHDDRGPLQFDLELGARGIHRDVVATVQSFSGVAAFLRASPLLATLPAMLVHGALRGFASCPLPFGAHRLPMYLVWHQRNHLDPAHVWLRDEVQAVAGALLAARPA